MARTRKKGNPIVSAVVFGIFGIVLLFLGIRTFIGLHGKLLNVTTCDESEVKPGVYVEGTLTYGYGAYVEKTTTYNHTVTKTDGYYYLVDICDKNEDGSKETHPSGSEYQSPRVMTPNLTRSHLLTMRNQST